MPPVWNCLADLLGSTITADSWIPWLRLTTTLSVIAVIVVTLRVTRIA